MLWILVLRLCTTLEVSENKAGSFQLQSVTSEIQLGGSSENYYHQTQQWCCHISVDSSTSSEFAKARRPLILLRIVSAGATSEWSRRDNYPLPYTTSKPWAEFHLVVHWQHFTFTCRHLSRHCATYKAGENRILQIWTGVPVICSHTHFHLPNCK